jgi:hypothetical protein
MILYVQCIHKKVQKRFKCYVLHPKKWQAINHGMSRPLGELSMGRVVRGTSCPSGELSMKWALYGVNCSWGKLSIGNRASCAWGKMPRTSVTGRDFLGQVVMGRVVRKYCATIHFISICTWWFWSPDPGPCPWDRRCRTLCGRQGNQSDLHSSQPIVKM